MAMAMARRFANAFVTSALVCVTVTDKVASVGQVEGTSMQPTLNPSCSPSSALNWLFSDRVLVNKWASRDYNYNRGDVVVLRSPEKPESCMIKRLIALEGDWVSVPGRRDVVKIPSGFCWVEGDNQMTSLDSKSFGAIPMALLCGKVTHLLWPLDRVGILESRLPEGRVRNFQSRF